MKSPDDAVSPPDLIAHKLVTHVGFPAEIFLLDNEITVPIEPFDGEVPAQETVPAASFKAVIEAAEITDGGMTLFGMNGLHLPAAEWERLGLQKHWDHPDADLQSPFFPPKRKFEIWATREFHGSEPDNEFTTAAEMDTIPTHSPVLTEFQASKGKDSEIVRPPSFSRPHLILETVLTKNVTETHGMERIIIGKIARVDILKDIPDWPEEPDIEPRDFPV